MLPSPPKDRSMAKACCDKLVKFLKSDSFVALWLSICWTSFTASRGLVLDDPAYLALAKVWAKNIAEPYGPPPQGEMFNWYGKPQPFFTILAPPVVPGWLMVGLRAGITSSSSLHFWMIPFAWIYAYALLGIARSLNLNHPRWAVSVAVFNPATFLGLNLMLDVPAIAIALSGVLLLRNHINSSVHCLLAGLLFGLAFETKYSSLPLLGLGLFLTLREGNARSILALNLGMVSIIVAWEGYMAFLYGHSHFLLHTQSSSTTSGLSRDPRFKMLLPLFIQVGLAIFPVVLCQARTKWIHPLAWFVTAEMALILTYFVGNDMGIIGCIMGAAVLLCCVTSYRNNRIQSILIIWIAVELIGYFFLAPFPAFRRMIPLVIPLIFLSMNRIDFSRTHKLAMIFGISFHLGIFLLADVQEAIQTKQMAAQIKSVVNENERVYFSGRWGWRAALEEQGAKAWSQGVSWKPGDWLVETEIEFGNTLPQVDLMNVPARIHQQYEWSSNFRWSISDRIGGGTVPIGPTRSPYFRWKLYRLGEGD
jgi:hypothetical protein